ncbi:hypothetical protein ABGN35_004523 [Yersinia enterocolitica]
MTVKPQGHKRDLLEPYRKEMEEMRAKGFSYQQIADWLLTKELVVSKGTVRNILK